MATARTLDILGYHDRPVPHRYLRPRGAIDHLVVLLPGFGYTCDMPLFYYAENRALDVGVDVLRVDYAYNRLPEFQEAAPAERRQWLLADAEAAVQAALAQRTYQGVTLIGKSLGTAAMAHLLPTASPNWRAVWLTPLLAEPPVRSAVEAFTGPELIVIGTADPHYDPALLTALAAKPGTETVVVEGADHGMDLPGDPVASVQALSRYVAALVPFLP